MPRTEFDPGARVNYVHAVRIIVAIACSLVLAVTSLTPPARTVAAGCQPQGNSCCDHCASCCAQNSAPATQPAAPAPVRTATPQQIQLLLTTVTPFVALPPVAVLQVFPASSPLRRTPGIPLFERDCVWLI